MNIYIDMTMELFDKSHIPVTLTINHAEIHSVITRETMSTIKNIGSMGIDVDIKAKDCNVTLSLDPGELKTINNLSDLSQG